MNSRRCAVALCCLAACFLVVHPATAQERLSMNTPDPRFADTPILTDSVDFIVGGYLIALDTSAALGGAYGLGSVLQLEEILGLDTHQNLLRLGIDWNVARKHSIGLTWFDISRSASGFFEESVDFLDLTFAGHYESTFNVSYYGFEYRYSLINNNRIDAGFSLGVSTFDLSVSIAGEATVIGDDPSQPEIEVREAAADILAPVPAFGMFIDYAITRRLIVGSTVQYIDLTVGDYDGRFMDLAFTVDYFVSRHFSIGGGLASTDITFADTGDDPYRIDYRYSGVLFHVRGSF